MQKLKLNEDGMLSDEERPENKEYIEYMRKKLGLIEKCALRRQGIKDCGDAFLSSKSFDGTRTVWISPFISSELMQLAMDVRHLFSSRWCIVVLRTEQCKPYYRVMRLSRALALIEARFFQFESMIQECCLRYSPLTQNLENLRDCAQKNGERHLEELYKRKIDATEIQFKDETAKCNRAMKFLLAEKIRLLNNTFSLYDILRGRQLLRIQYYYQFACDGKDQMHVEPLQIEDFEPLIDNTVPKHFEDELVEIGKRMSKTDESFGYFKVQKGV